jgi:hypothetical protein
MTKEDLKLIKEIAATCRKAGISYFKNDKFEFTLTGEAPQPQKPRGKAAALKANATSIQDDVESEGFDKLSPEEQVLWSAGAFASE